MKKYRIISVPSELGAGTRGASLGLDALKVEARTKGERFFSEIDIIELREFNHVLDSPPKYPNAQYADEIALVGESVCDTVVDVLEDQGHCLILSGDHSMAFASICGVKKAFPDKRLGIIWIDAHADLHSPYTSPTGNMHGMPLAMAAAEDNMESKINDPLEDAVEAWSKLKNTGVKGAKYEYRDLFYIGVRSVEKPEVALMEKNNITNVTVDELRERGIAEVVKEAEAQLADCDLIYISFDVDSMDPSVSKGTGTPVEHGLTFEEAKELNTVLTSLPKVKAWEMVEINPTLDTENRMAKHAYQILKNVLANFQNK